MCARLGGDFKYFFLFFTPKIGEDSHFDKYFSTGLKPPTSCAFSYQHLTRNNKASMRISDFVRIEIGEASTRCILWQRHNYTEICGL